MSLTVIHVPRQHYNAETKQRELDPSTAFLEDFSPGQGQLTLVCWARAWSHYWGAIGKGTLADFLQRADTGYIVDKLMLPSDVILQRSKKREEQWLQMIVDALKAQLLEVSP